MRNIKFRAWNIQTKKMIDLQKITPLAMDAKLLELGTKGLFIPFDEHMILMQFTGLLDKHGKEVFEGDIVKAVLHDRYEKPKEVTETVEISDGFLAPFYMRVEYEEEWWKERLVDGFEIIGNIYESPELLEVKP